MGILSLLPVKDWLYIGVIAALFGVFGWYTVHERHIGEAKILAQDAKLAAAQVIHNQEVEARAQQLIEPSVIQLRSAIAAPPAADAPHVFVCKRAAPAAAVPANGGAGQVDHGTADVPAPGPSDSEDIGPPIDHLFSVADAHVRALQKYIQSCIDVGICKAP